MLESAVISDNETQYERNERDKEWKSPIYE